MTVPVLYMTLVSVLSVFSRRNSYWFFHESYWCKCSFKNNSAAGFIIFTQNYKFHCLNTITISCVSYLHSKLLTDTAWFFQASVSACVEMKMVVLVLCFEALPMESNWKEEQTELSGDKVKHMRYVRRRVMDLQCVIWSV